MKVGVYSFGSCEGCRYRLVHELLRLASELGLEIAYEPLLGLNEESESYDIVLIEGAVASEEDLEKLKSTRNKAKFLVALGSCASLGGIPGLRRFARDEDVGKVYGQVELPRTPLEAAPLSKYVKVDYWIRGCPPTEEELTRVLRTIASQAWFRLGERRLDFCREETFDVPGTAIYLQGDKCIVCGRCVSVCKAMTISAINYAQRSIETMVTTPFKTSFDKSSCISCGQCTLYCPVGALVEKSSIEEVQSLLRNGTELTAYIEPESIAALGEVFGYDDRLEGKVVAALKKLGFRRVVLWRPRVKIDDLGKPAIVPASMAESLFVKKFYPELLDFTTRPPHLTQRNQVLITPCVAKKLSLNGPVLTTRELARMLSKFEIELLRAEAFDQVELGKDEINTVKAVGPKEVRSVLEKVKQREITKGIIMLYICPGGCLFGGGQPFAKPGFEETRKKSLDELLARLRISSLSQLH